jgi:hypothetical protein
LRGKPKESKQWADEIMLPERGLEKIMGKRAR